MEDQAEPVEKAPGGTESFDGINPKDFSALSLGYVLARNATFSEQTLSCFRVLTLLFFEDYA